MDIGYADADPALLLAHWKYFLRATTDKQDARAGPEQLGRCRRSLDRRVHFC